MSRRPVILTLPVACVFACLCVGCSSDAKTIVRPQYQGALPAEGRFGGGGVDHQTRTAYPAGEGAIRLTDTDELVYVFDGQTGEPLTGRQVAQQLHSADIVILGEMHTDPMAHRLQHRFVREALWEDGALSIEMMSRDEQATLARARSNPAAAEAQLAVTSLTGWPRWNQFYLPVIQEALTMDRPVIAANAPRSIVREARLYGYDYLRDLPREQQQLFDLPHDVDAFPEYRERVTAIVAGHPASQPTTQPTTRPRREQMDAHAPQDVADALPAQSATPPTSGPTTRTYEQRPAGDPEAFFEAQLLWDATMASSILRARQHARPVVHLVGSFHSDYDGGLTDMLRRRGMKVVTVSLVPSDAQQLQRDDAGRANVVIYTGADRPLPPEQPRRSAASRPATQPATAPR